MKFRILLWISFCVSLLFFIEALLTDYFYSNCVGIGSAVMTCTNHASFLYPLVGNVNHGLLLGPLANPDGMGQVAGIGFIGSLLSWFFLRVETIGNLQHKVFPPLFETLILSGSLYVFAFVGFLVFLPFCVVYQCRVTNYLPWLSYDNALVGSAIVLCIGMLGKFYFILKRVKQELPQSLPNPQKETR